MENRIRGHWLRPTSWVESIIFTGENKCSRLYQIDFIKDTLDLNILDEALIWALNKIDEIFNLNIEYLIGYKIRVYMYIYIYPYLIDMWLLGLIFYYSVDGYLIQWFSAMLEEFNFACDVYTNWLLLSIYVLLQYLTFINNIIF